MTDVSTPWSRGNVDFTAAGTDHRRRVAEAARKRLAVLDHATHYTSTTYAAEPRVVDHGHGGDHGKRHKCRRPLALARTGRGTGTAKSTGTGRDDRHT